MKKFIGVIAIAAVLIAGVYFGVRFATASKAKEQLAKFMEGLEWSVDSAYFNPLTQKLVANGLVLALESDTKLALKTIKVSKSLFNLDGAEVSGSANLNELRLYSDTEDLEFNIKLISAPKIVFDKNALQEFIKEIKEGESNAYMNPLKQISGFKTEGLVFSYAGMKILDVDSILIDGSYVDDKGNTLPYPVEGNSLIKNLIFKYPGKKSEYKIEKIKSVSTYKDGIYDGQVEFDGQKLFLLKASSVMSGLSNYMENTMGSVIIHTFDLDYTDRGLVNILLDLYADTMQDKYSDEDKPLSRKDSIDQISALAAIFSFAVKDGAKLTENLTAFLTDPKTMVIKMNPEGPVVLDDVTGMDELGLTISFNGEEPFALLESEKSYNPYEDEFDYEEGE
jgi:hypothetical protein